MKKLRDLAIRCRLFKEDDDGAVTVDWVVLTAAIVGVGLVVMSIIRGGIYDAASDIYQSVTAGLE